MLVFWSLLLRRGEYIYLTGYDSFKIVLYMRLKANIVRDFQMMNTLLLEPGDLLQILSTTLEKGKFVKLQPQSVNFLDISDPKAVLENALRNFSALTKNDILSFLYNDTVYEIAVLEVKPETEKNAIGIIETDLEVDFAAPVGYVEPQRSIPTSSASTRPSSALGGNLATAGKGAMAAEIGYQAPTTGTSSNNTLKPPSSDIFARGGQKLSAKKSSKTSSPAPTPAVSTPPTASSTVFKPQSRIINASDLGSTMAAPQPLRLQFGKLFFGYEIKPVKKKDDPENATSSDKKHVFSGGGQSLRSSDGKKTKRKDRDETVA